MIFPLKMVIFHSFLLVYQRVMGFRELKMVLEWRLEIP
jgi:hypothetical protein